MSIRSGFYLLFDDERLVGAPIPVVVAVAPPDWAKIEVSLGSRPVTIEYALAESARLGNQKQVE